MDWSEVLPLLERWHQQQDPVAGRAVFTFLEEELRAAAPRGAREGEDAIRDVLAKLVATPLPAKVRNLKAYLVTAVFNRARDRVRERQRREKGACAAPPRETADADPAELVASAEAAARVRRALARLDITDRVAFKVAEAPEWIDDQELAWLAARMNRSLNEVREIVANVEDRYEVTRVFDPGEDDPSDPVARRRRMERFRKRCNRIAERVGRLMAEDRP